MLQIVMSQTAARAIGLPLRPHVHNAAERDRSADSGRARQPVFRPRPSQPCSFCGRRSGALSGRRLSRIHVPDGYGSLLYALAILFSRASVAHLPEWKRAEVFGWRMGRQAGYLATAPSKAGELPKMLAAGGPHQVHNGNSGARIRSAPVQSTGLKGKPTLRSDPAVRSASPHSRWRCPRTGHCPRTGQGVRRLAARVSRRSNGA